MPGRRKGRHKDPLGANKACDVERFVGNLRARQITPHIAIDGRTTCHPGYAISRRCRKRIEEVFGWIKIQAVFTFAAAYNLVRLPKLIAKAMA